MKAKVTKEGVLIPVNLLEGVKEVEIRKENGLILVVPQKDDAEPRTVEAKVEGSTENEGAYVLAERSLANAYGEDEPEYSLNLIKELNPEYEGR